MIEALLLICKVLPYLLNMGNNNKWWVPHTETLGTVCALLGTSSHHTTTLWGFQLLDFSVALRVVILSYCLSSINSWNGWKERMESCLKGRRKATSLPKSACKNHKTRGFIYKKHIWSDSVINSMDLIRCRKDIWIYKGRKWHKNIFTHWKENICVHWMDR